MENKKYVLTDETIEYDGHKLYRIKAIKDFRDVSKGDLGGWVESVDNLAQGGNCWIYGNAKVFGNAKIFHDAIACENARIWGNAKVHFNAKVFGEANICGDAEIKSVKDYAVFRNTWSSGRYFTWTRSNNKWDVGCFYGTGEELIEKVYKDSELSGKCYEAIVKTQEEISKLIN